LKIAGFNSIYDKEKRPLALLAFRITSCLNPNPNPESIPFSPISRVGVRVNPYVCFVMIVIHGLSGVDHLTLSFSTLLSIETYDLYPAITQKKDYA
jgi:hypothetical protein